MARRGITINTRDVQRRLGMYKVAAINRAQIGMHVKVANDENRAKSTRRWQDRTGYARRSITGSVYYDEGVVRGGLSIGASYGVFLELANGGVYAIIWPTLLRHRMELTEIGRLALMGGAS